MKVHLRADSANGVHTRFTVFMNGINCGQLCMTEEEAIHFHHMVLMTTYKAPKDKYYSTGYWVKITHLEGEENDIS